MRLGASLLASYQLFCLVWWASSARPEAIPLPVGRSGYLSFLGLFWMTAPLAWLYPIPYDRFLSYEAAIDANVATLGLVALWRVLLTMRFVAVCADLKPRAAVGIVLGFSAFAAAAAVIGYFMANISLVGMMGGLRPLDGPRDRAHQWMAQVGGAVCWVFTPVLLISCPRRRHSTRTAGS
ncbi:MAG: hypothetical protein K2W96_19145 [Gemmataceae bacterium]|nr:hypothetical protein [Gemmataceae bacterium]